jgi:hypothetical protein
MCRQNPVPRNVETPAIAGQEISSLRHSPSSFAEYGKDEDGVGEFRNAPVKSRATPNLTLASITLSSALRFLEKNVSSSPISIGLWKAHGYIRDRLASPACRTGARRRIHIPHQPPDIDVARWIDVSRSSDCSNLRLHRLVSRHDRARGIAESVLARAGGRCRLCQFGWNALPIVVRSRYQNLPPHSSCTAVPRPSNACRNGSCSLGNTRRCRQTVVERLCL